jgi:hypothetical protein
VADYPALWYALWLIIAVFGVTTWYLRNFTTKVEMTKLSAYIGVTAMITMLIWTFRDF